MTVLDNSPKQLEGDRLVANRERVHLFTVQADMADLGMFAAESFDIVVHPVSNLFVPNVLPVWKEAFRVLRPSGPLIAGFCNPVIFLFDYDAVRTQEDSKSVFPFLSLLWIISMRRALAGAKERDFLWS